MASIRLCVLCRLVPACGSVVVRRSSRMPSWFRCLSPRRLVITNLGQVKSIYLLLVEIYPYSWTYCREDRAILVLIQIGTYQKLSSNCSKIWRVIEEVHSLPRLAQVQASLHQEPMQNEVQIPTQVEAYVQLLWATLVANSWLHILRGVNLQHHHLHQWLLQQKIVEFNASSVEVVVMLSRSVDVT
jgi:hypothetical protein